ncbi:hypothetical protein T484DRAFT_1828947 [Baffinella frigidus]|nr:hypothetical protein T484DRAFT_1828947 [Cryptophyta sp. CCMP2293]
MHRTLTLLALLSLSEGFRLPLSPSTRSPHTAAFAPSAALHGFLAGNALRRPEAKCGASPVSDGGARQARGKQGALRMNGDPQWYAFQGFNLGGWKGRALHIDPSTGEYTAPFVR